MTGGKRAGFPSFFPTDDAVAFHYQIVNSEPPAQHVARRRGADLVVRPGDRDGLEPLRPQRPEARRGILVPAHGADQPRQRHGPQLRADREPGELGRLHLGDLHEPPPLRKRGDDRPVAERSAQLRRHEGRQRDVQEALGRGDRPQRQGGHRSEPPGVLPAGAGAARRQRARLLGAGAVQGNGQSCQSGDQCCNGYCEPGGADGGLVCTSTPPNANCSNVGDKCTTAADCCDSTNLCINGFCSPSTAQ